MGQADNPHLDPAARRRRLVFRASHRGMKEIDILLARFLDRELAGMSDAEITEFEALLKIPDQDFYAMLVKDRPVPERYDTDLMRRLIASSQEP